MGCYKTVNMKDIKYFKTYDITDLRDMLYKTTLNNKKKTAFRLKDKTGRIYNVSYEEFKKDVEAFGSKLINMKLTSKRIAIIGKNSYNWAVSYFASCIVGVVVPIDKELHTDDVINFLNISESSLIIGDLKNIEDVCTKKNDIINKDIIFIDMDDSNKYINFSLIMNDGKKLLSNGNTSFKDIKIDPDELHTLLFTSGTSGKAKGVCLSHRNICSNIVSIASTVKVDNSASVLSILPLHHTYECTIGYLLIIYGGGKIAYCEGLRYISKNINEYRPSFILCVPLLLEKMYKKIIKSLEESLPEKYKRDDGNIIDSLPFYMRYMVKLKIKKSLGGNLRTFIVGAAALNPSIIEFFFNIGIKVLQGYGLTECSPLVAGNNDFMYKATSCGMPIPNVEYKINNPNEEGIGEIIVKGPNVMLGYYNNEEMTKSVMKDGWFYTGDLGYIDEDYFLYITGKSKNVIVTKNGKKIYPEEIEYYLDENEFISESLVIGSHKENDDETYVKAQIFPNFETIKEHLHNAIPTKEDINKIVSDIVKSVNEKLPNYKHIKLFKIEEK